MFAKEHNSKTPNTFVEASEHAQGSPDREGLGWRGLPPRATGGGHHITWLRTDDFLIKHVAFVR